MKVFITEQELATILAALASSETRWRIEAGEQTTGTSRNACLQVAVELHDIYVSLESQTTEPIPEIQAQHIDPFDTPTLPWDPNDPRNW
jgi:hypothetical protein